MSRTHRDLPSDGRTSHSLLCPGHGVYTHDPVDPDPEDCFFCSVPFRVRLAWHLHGLTRELEEASKKAPGLRWVGKLVHPLRAPLCQVWVPRYLIWHSESTSTQEVI